MTYNPDVFGYVNGKAVFSRDEFIFEKRGFGEIETVSELLAYAEKVTYGWCSAGWKRTFESFYLSDYALSEPCASLTKKEFARLKELQAEAKAAAKRAEDAKQWQKVDTIYYADNSVEDVYRDKDGNEKREVVVPPHGDAC